MKTAGNERTHAVLFDLDNTLILFDENRFFKAYIPKIARFFGDLMDETVFTRRLLESTQTMLMNHGETTNARFFMEQFTGKSFDQTVWDRFITFYRDEFDSFASLVKPTPGVLDVFRTIRNWPLKIIIASNPVWPLMVQKKRLAWAGLADFTFDFITHIENMSYCKPHTGFYLEICDAVDVLPENCFMAGNDPDNDMAAGKTGMTTFLVEDSIGHQTDRLTMSRKIRAPDLPGQLTPDFHGLLKEVPCRLEKWLKRRK